MHWFKILPLGLTGFLLANAVPAAGAATQWLQGHNVRSRVIAGQMPDGDARTPMALVQLELDPGWKTYWRHPGEAGGIPPEFSWQASGNLRAARVLYPAPMRLTDDAGATIGYKAKVAFPVELTARDADKPIELNLQLRFGICKDICIPAEATHNIQVPRTASDEFSSVMRRALDRIPRSAAGRRSLDPQLTSVGKPVPAGDSVSVAIIAAYPQTISGADLFLEAPAGLFVPLPKKTTELQDNQVRFEIVLSTTEYRDLKGKPLRATLVSDLGHSTVEFTLH